MKESLNEAPSGCHLSPSNGFSSHLFDFSEDSGMSVASSTEKSVNGTASGLLVPLVESLGILLTLQFSDSSWVSIIAFDSASPGFPSAGVESLPGSGPVTESLPSLQFLIHLLILLLLTGAIFETSILPLDFVGATMSPI